MSGPIAHDSSSLRKRFETELSRLANLSFQTERLGLSIPNTIRESSEFNDKIQISDLEKNIVFLDETISLYISLNFVLLAILKQMLDEKFEDGLPFVR